MKRGSRGAGAPAINIGEMAEWFKAAVLKTAVLETVPGVRIPLSPPTSGSRCLKPCQNSPHPMRITPTHVPHHSSLERFFISDG